MEFQYHVRVNGQMLGALSQQEIFLRAKNWQRPNIVAEVAPIGTNKFIPLAEFLYSASNTTTSSTGSSPIKPLPQKKTDPGQMAALLAAIAVFLGLIAWGGYIFFHNREAKKLQEEINIALQEEQTAIAQKLEMENKEKERKLLESERKRKVYKLAEEQKNKIIDSVYDGGVNKGVEVNDWEYFPDDDSFRIKVQISWNGNFDPSNYYSAEGYITIYGDGSGSRWNPTWVNTTLTEYQKNKNIMGAAIGAIYVIDELTKE